MVCGGKDRFVSHDPDGDGLGVGTVGKIDAPCCQVVTDCGGPTLDVSAGIDVDPLANRLR